MEWVKSRVFIYDQEYPNYTDTAHLVFMRLRSDGTMWYQTGRLKTFAKVRIEDSFSYFLADTETKAEKFDEAAFDEEFSRQKARYRGTEVNESDIPESMIPSKVEV